LNLVKPNIIVVIAMLTVWTMLTGIALVAVRHETIKFLVFLLYTMKNIILEYAQRVLR
jgi:hypothetical protein